MAGPFTLSKSSNSKLLTCTPNIQRIIRLVIRYIDIKVIYGHRGPDIQAQLFVDERSTSDGVNQKSLHQFSPSPAIDIAPFPVLWPDEPGITSEEVAHRLKRFHVLAGIMFGVGMVTGAPIRGGIDWDQDWQYNDQRLIDLGHFEDIKARRLP